MALCNDNMWGYATHLIAKYKVRWIEAAVVLPCWTNMIVYYIEGDYGHLMTERLGKQQFRTAVRGHCFSFQVPWEEILQCLKNTVDDITVSGLPRDEECLKYLLRLHIKVAGEDFTKNLKQVHLRPFVLVLLLHDLIEHKHEAFAGKGSAETLKQRMRKAVEQKYPEREGHLPESERQGFIPPGIQQLLEERAKERA